MSHQILCVGFTPALQRILTFSTLQLGAVNRAVHQDLAAAGKGVNVAKVLKSLGSEPRVTGFLAGASGRMLADFLNALKVENQWIWCAGETRNAHTLIHADTAEVTELVEEAVNPSADKWEEALNLTDHLLDGVQAVALCGALAPGSDPAVYARVIQLAHRKGLPCLVDAKGDELKLALGATPLVAKMNVDELAHTTACSISSEVDVLSCLGQLSEGGAENILVTQGKSAAYLRSAEGCWRFIPPSIKSINPIGSGDAVTAGILHAHCEGDGIVKAVAFGLACGSANAETSRPGEFPLDRAEALYQQVEFSQINESDI